MDYSAYRMLAAQYQSLVGRVRKTRLPAPGRMLQGSQDDTGYVPEWVIPALEAYARSVGYKVEWTDPERLGAYGASGATASTRMLRAGFPPVIFINPDMSAASQARVLIHEITHAERIRRRIMDEHSDYAGGENIAEEVLAETVTALVTASLGITDGRFSAAYLRMRERDCPGIMRRVQPAAQAHAQTILGYLSRARYAFAA